MSVSPLLFEKYLTAAEEISTYSKFDMKNGFTFSKTEVQPESKAVTENKSRKNISQLLARFYPHNFTIERYLPRLMEAVNEFNLNGRPVAKLKDYAKKYRLHEYIIRRGIIYFFRFNIQNHNGKRCVTLLVPSKAGKIRSF